MPAPVRWLETTFGMSGMYSAIVANSRIVEDEYRRHPYRYRKRLCRIDHGFEPRTSALTSSQARAALGLPPSPVLLGCAARLHRSKNLAAAIRLLPHDPRWHLALAGQGPDRDALEALARELDCADRVHFVGELCPARVGSFLRALDVFVFPSSQETFGLAAVEAAQAGVPVVANKLDVLEEVLRFGHEPCALFVPADDTGAFASEIRRLLADPTLTATLSARGRALKGRYSVDAMADGYAALIERQ
jgi:glycosyltransferase involved in cell wall biosynthesis